MRLWPKTLSEAGPGGTPVPCTCYYYVGMKKKQVHIQQRIRVLALHIPAQCTLLL